MPWLVGFLLLAGVVSAGILAVDDDRPKAVVSATGSQSGTIDVTSTVTVPIPATSTPAPTTTLRTTTTLSPAAVAVLRAIASTTTTTRPPATTTTTSPPAPTTTLTPPTTTIPPPTTSRVPRFTVTMANEHTHAFDLSINGQVFRLAPGQTRALVDIPTVPAGQPDIVKVMAPGDDKCGVQDQGALFADGSRWLLRVVVGAGTCTGDFAMPRLAISAL